MALHLFLPARARRALRRRRRRPARRGFIPRLILVAGGGFVGTLAALQLAPSLPATFADLSARAASTDPLSARFGLCHRGGGRDCVVDGDTFWFAGEKYRIDDIDTPEPHTPRCAEEAPRGAAATGRTTDISDERGRGEEGG